MFYKLLFYILFYIALLYGLWQIRLFFNTPNLLFIPTFHLLLIAVTEQRQRQHPQQHFYCQVMWRDKYKYFILKK